ncbi:2,6-dihydroxypyridine 3-monooxygenase [Lachnellula suecica]|uniref:2,6-dihydroxypyridine 3-monooxygenase n=1 Tax=Lachnellula suecica TaxID=602035 RepID=A0A8T9CMH6_9HELO|nr:2,6-dihydroxypyridine 3-monooxygenase [Lachnellula suecica]
MTVVVVGGSLSGLFHAIVLKHLGHNVHVLEKSSQTLLESQAAGLNAGPDVQKLIDLYIKSETPYGMPGALVEIVDREGVVINSFPPNATTNLTTWRILYNILKSHLLGEATTLATYETEKLVGEVNYDGEMVSVSYTDIKTGVSDVRHADLVIAADGGHSSIREGVIPDSSPEYVGYVTWRGAVPEPLLCEASRSFLSNRVFMLRAEHGFILSYHVPSDNGSLKPGECQFIWAWYEKLDEHSDDFNENFTDISGKRHFTTVPRGKMQPKVWEKRQECGNSLNPPFAELLEKTSDPFVSAIRERQSPKSVFYDGKLLLVGDAFALFRPHLGSSTNQAAMQALGLAEVLEGRSDLVAWERKSVEYAMKTAALGNAYGEYCFTGKVPDSISAAIRPDESYT